MKGNQSDGIKRVWSSIFWPTCCPCVLGGRICCITMGLTSMGAGPVICGTGGLLCPPVLK